MKLLRILIAVAAIALADIIYLFTPDIREVTPMSMFYLVVLICTVGAGVLSGGVAIILGFFSAWYFNLPPRYTFGMNAEAAVSLLVYLVTALAIFLVSYRLLIAEGRAVSIVDWVFRDDERG